MTCPRYAYALVILYQILKGYKNLKWGQFAKNNICFLEIFSSLVELPLMYLIKYNTSKVNIRTNI